MLKGMQIWESGRCCQLTGRASSVRHHGIRFWMATTWHRLIYKSGFWKHKRLRQLWICWCRASTPGFDGTRVLTINWQSLIDRSASIRYGDSGGCVGVVCGGSHGTEGGEGYE